MAVTVGAASDDPHDLATADSGRAGATAHDAAGAGMAASRTQPAEALSSDEPSAAGGATTAAATGPTAAVATGVTGVGGASKVDHPPTENTDGGRGTHANAKDGRHGNFDIIF